jgi:kumamolisin
MANDEAAPNSTDPAVPLPGSHRYPKAAFAAVGPAPPGDAVRVVIKLKPQTEPPAASLVGRLAPVQRPAQSSRQALAASYGAPAEALRQIAGFAGANGLTVVESSAEKRMVVLTGTVKATARAFGTELKIFQSAATGERYRGRVGPVLVPSALADVVTSITGLDDRRQVRRRHRFAARPAEAPPAADLARTSYAAADLAEIYQFPQALDGTGQCIGILEFGGGFLQSDIDSHFGAAAPTITVVQVAGAGNQPGDPDYDGEVTLDIEVASGAAPGARLAVYFAPETEAGWVEAVTNAVHDTVNRPSVLSISYGLPEFQSDGNLAWTGQTMTELNNTFAEAAQLGITVIVAAGDDGSSFGNAGEVHAAFPASSPNVLACGGTSLPAGGREVVWSNGIRAQGDGHGTTGGGVSDFFPIPDWQSRSTARIPLSATTGFAGRGLPDIAANADPRTGYQIYFRGAPQAAGGTSASTPLCAALIARINQRMAQGPGGSVGYVTPLLYEGIGASSCNDVISGSNDALDNLHGAYTAGVGWDACTGWGTPNGNKLAAAFAGAASGAGSASGQPVAQAQPTKRGRDTALAAALANARRAFSALDRLIEAPDDGNRSPASR